MSMAREKNSGEYLWATEMWHKRLLNYEEYPGRLARLFTGLGCNSDEDDDTSKTVCDTVVKDDD